MTVAVHISGAHVKHTSGTQSALPLCSAMCM